MKDTKKTQNYVGITIDKVLPYQPYVATLHVKKDDKIINKVVIFMKTKEGICKLNGYDENHSVYGKPNVIKISEKNNTIRPATPQDLKDFSKRVRMVSMK